MNYFNDNQQAFCSQYCPLECDSFNYDISTHKVPAFKYAIYDKLDLDPRNLTINSTWQILTSGLNEYSFTVYYEDLKYTYISQQAKVEFIDLISNIGGSLGLFLGISFISFLELFDNDHDKCDTINEMFCRKYNFENNLKICGQTYSRKYDVLVFQNISSICQTIYKIMNDIRLLSSKMEIYEFFDKEQIGSSAMPYKMNPITCEKICSLCRYVINQENCMSQTYLNQWLERTLDDSAIKRIIYPNCFLLLEYILNETIKCISTLIINNNQITNNVLSHMPYILSEQIILNGVKLGYSRQDIHERLRIILIKIKQEDQSHYNSTNNIKSLFKNDDIVDAIIKTTNISIDPENYIGRSVYQINTFYENI
jgi:adenylosuccinate lyase